MSLPSNLLPFAGYVAHHNLLAERLDPAYGRLPGSSRRLQLDDGMLHAAAVRYELWHAAAEKRVEDKMLSHSEISTTDPFASCLVCGETPREALDDGEAVGFPAPAALQLGSRHLPASPPALAWLHAVLSSSEPNCHACTPPSSRHPSAR